MFKLIGSKISSVLSFNCIRSAGDDSPTAEPIPAADAFLCSCSAANLEKVNRYARRDYREEIIKMTQKEI